MSHESYLMFKLNHSRYGIPATAVQELFFLPEVTAIAETPITILGVINLRGKFLPVMDLYHRLEQARPPFQLTDSMIVLEWQTQRIGIIANQVDSVQAIAPDQIAANICGELKESLPDGLVTGIANAEEGIVTLLNPELLVQYVLIETAFNPNSDFHNGSDAPKHPSDSPLNQGLYDHFDSQERQVFRERTESLRCALADEDLAWLLPLAVVGLGGEYFGFGLETVHEFTEIHKITPIPCCPPHIVGNINLRGEIITLININDVVDLPMKGVRSPTVGSTSHQQAVVVRLEQRVAGIAVDDIFDVTYIHPSQMTPAPIALHSAKDDYLQGVAPYRDRMMSIINLSKLLTSEVLVVNEEV
ncbi:chemotaxis protein CheW [Nostoc foliaceum]|uniref:Chemotaxis protein CheW n=3 Tax=Nostoc TaxID=1177 RepID=A0ABR8IJ83_9NOSO|nr:chemotaxis protein CheW [Nostoc foliaceum]MBD2565456.1 chemotaxis protein CheW [Nostoc linckia FACHB-391]MBD2651238.1 chemotaxis protein CheW [Nostoc foliaceum FACHB-393]